MIGWEDLASAFAFGMGLDHLDGTWICGRGRGLGFGFEFECCSYSRVAGVVYVTTPKSVVCTEGGCIADLQHMVKGKTQRSSTMD